MKPSDQQSQVQEVKNPKEIVTQLRAEVNKSPAFNAICQVFALRERSRQRVTLNSLMATMAREGFDFTRDQYIEALKSLATLGIGVADYDSKGKFRSLKDIKTTLQSIGFSALSKKENLDKQILPNIFTNLPGEGAPKKRSKTVLRKAQENVIAKPIEEQESPMLLKLIFHGKTATFELAPNVKASDVFTMLAELYVKRAES